MKSNLKTYIAKKLLIFTIDLDCNGAARVAALISQGMAKRGWEVIIVVFEDRISFPYAGRLISMNIPRSLAKRPDRFIPGILKFKSIVKQENPDVILTFTPAPSSIAVLSKFFSTKFPSVFNGAHIIHTQLKDFSNRIIGTYLIKTLYPKSDGIIAVSNGVKQDLIENLKIKPDKITMIYNPLDLKRIQKLAQEPVNEEPFNGDIPILINVGQLIEFKGQQHLIKVFARLKKEYELKLVIMGSGELEVELKKLTQKLGVEENVYFLGWRDNVFKCMAASHIFVFPSLIEAFGMVLVEAMACGLPCVSFDCKSGPREILGDSEYGLMVTVGDEEGLYQAIKNLLDDENLRKTLSEKGKERVKKFEIDKIMEEYEELFSRRIYKRKRYT